VLKTSMVSVLFPVDCFEALHKLCDPEVHLSAGVPVKNSYLFPCTGSDARVSGWHAVNKICQDANILSLNLLTATKMRHRVSTIYEGIEVQEKDRDQFYRHLGHTRSVNQAPIAESAILKVGVHLQRMDGQWVSADANRSVMDAVSVDDDGQITGASLSNLATLVNAESDNPQSTRAVVEEHSFGIERAQLNETDDRAEVSSVRPVTSSIDLKRCSSTDSTIDEVAGGLKKKRQQKESFGIEGTQLNETDGGAEVSSVRPLASSIDLKRCPSTDSTFDAVAGGLKKKRQQKGSFDSESSDEFIPSQHSDDSDSDFNIHFTKSRG